MHLAGRRIHQMQDEIHEMTHLADDATSA